MSSDDKDKKIKVLEKEVAVLNCYFCGKELPQGTNYCSSCDHETITDDPFKKKPTKKRPYLWYILPLLLGIVGGVIAYFILKNEPKERKYCLIIGGVVNVIGFIVNWIIMENIFSFPI